MPFTAMVSSSRHPSGLVDLRDWLDESRRAGLPDARTPLSDPDQAMQDAGAFLQSPWF
jgi:hypothetical protein